MSKGDVKDVADERNDFIREIPYPPPDKVALITWTTFEIADPKKPGAEFFQVTSDSNKISLTIGGVESPKGLLKVGKLKIFKKVSKATKAISLSVMALILLAYQTNVDNTTLTAHCLCTFFGCIFYVEAVYRALLEPEINRMSWMLVVTGIIYSISVMICLPYLFANGIFF